MKARAADWMLTGAVLMACLLGFYLLREFALRLPLYASHYRGFAIWGLLQSLNGTRIVTFLFLLLGCGVLQWWRGCGLRELPPIVRALLIAAVGVQTYTMALLDYNHYFDNWLIADRLILVALAVVGVLRPLFLPFFLVQLLVLTGQLKSPDIIGFDNVHKSIFLPIIGFVWAYAVLSRFVRVKNGDFLPVLLMMAPLSLWYINAGIGKLELDWQRQNSLYHLFAAATEAGWLAEWTHEWKLSLGNFLNVYGEPLLWSTIALEILLPLFMFFNRTAAIVASVSLMVFHLFVYLFSGILFWQWSVLELTLMYFLLFRPDQVAPLFNWKMRCAYWLLLLTVPLSVHIGKLAWYDCGFINRYAFYLVDRDGKETEIDATYFSPYDTGFAKNRFYFTTRFRTVANTYGQCNDAALLGLVSDWGSHADEDNRRYAEDYRSAFGMDRYDGEKDEEFRRFLSTFISNKNRYDPRLISHLSVPPHMQQGPDQRNLQIGELDHLKVVFREKVILPELNYLTIRQDSFRLSLASQPE